MNALLRFLSLQLTASLFLAAAASQVRAEETAAPPNLRDVSTGEAVPAAETTRTKDFGAVVKRSQMGTVRFQGSKTILNAPGSAGALQLRAGDLILAVDDWRIHDFREYEIARYKQPTAPKMVLLINRRGTLETLRFEDLPPGRNLGVDFDEKLEQSSFADVVEACGVVLDSSSRAALKSVSRHAAAELEAWRRNAGPKPDAVWVEDFVKLFLAVQQRSYAGAVSPAHQLPIPIFQRLAKFYAAIAEKNKVKEVLPANWAEYGESAEFFVLNRPMPAFIAPPLGDLKLSDVNFQRLLEKRRSNHHVEMEELSNAGRNYANSGTDRVEQFLNQTRASLLDPIQQGGWPFRSSLITEDAARTVMLSELRKRLANASDVDWPIVAYATLGPLCIEPLRREAADLLQELGKRSPYLGWRGGELCYVASRGAKFPGRELPRLNAVIRNNGYFLPKDAPALFRWALVKIPPILEETKQGGPTLDPLSLFSSSPLVELQALLAVEKKAEKPE